MPFQSDIRCPPIRVELNINYIRELLEDLHEEKEVDIHYDLYHYVVEIEDQFENFVNNHLHAYDSLEDWFLDNYDNVESYDDIEWVNKEE